MPSRSTLGRSDVMRTLSGSVFSRRFSRSVHENSRWPMMMLASRAAPEMASSCFGVDGLPRPRRVRSEFGRARLGRGRLTAERRLAARQQDDLRQIENRERDDDERSDAEHTVQRRARYKKDEWRGWCAACQAARSRASRPTSGASASSSSRAGGDPIHQGRGVARIDGVDFGAEPLLEGAAQIVGVLARLCGG